MKKVATLVLSLTFALCAQAEVRYDVEIVQTSTGGGTPQFPRIDHDGTVVYGNRVWKGIDNYYDINLNGGFLLDINNGFVAGSAGSKARVWKEGAVVWTSTVNGLAYGVNDFGEAVGWNSADVAGLFDTAGAFAPLPSSGYVRAHGVRINNSGFEWMRD